MRWADDGIVLSARPFGETGAIANIFTRANGRTQGLVKGGRSRRIRPILQTGNGVKVEWRARLDDQLGVYTLELSEATAARVLDDRISLCGASAVAAMLHVLPERDPHPKLFEAAQICLKAAGGLEFPAALVRFELRLLDELGFGLDLTRCAATGSLGELVYVSPKSGQAVSREAGEPYRAKLLALPGFLAEGTDGALQHSTDNAGSGVSGNDILDGLALTGYFLRFHVFEGTGTPMPQARELFEKLLRQRSGA